jgi:hypothetical protein
MALAARRATRAALAAEAAAPAPRDCSSWALACLALAARGDLMDCLLQGGAVVSPHAVELLSAPCIEYESIQLHDEVYNLSQFAVGGGERCVQMALDRLRLRQTGWSTATHRIFPPAFKSAARPVSGCSPGCCGCPSPAGPPGPQAQRQQCQAGAPAVATGPPS